MIRAVLDTNILVSAVIKPGGNPARVLREGREGKFELLIFEYILTELADVLIRNHIQRKYREQVTASKRSRYLESLRDGAELISVTSKVDAVPEDPKDNAILAGGVDGQANYIVTGDPHLLKLRTFRGIRIVTPVEFLENLKQES